MDVSVSAYMSDCLGVNGSFSVMKDLFGYQYHDSDQTHEGPISLKEQIRLGRKKSVNISVVLVAHENDFSGDITRAQVRRIQYSLQVMRNIFGQVDLGIRKIYWRRIPMSQVGGYSNISNRSEAEDLTDDFSSSNDGIDVFFVQSIGDAGGWSNVNGPCNKDSKDGLTGAVVELSGSDAFTGVLLAHEVAHYLKLSHTNSATNLMGQDANNDGIAELSTSNRVLTNSQGNSMKSHCSIRSAC